MYLYYDKDLRLIEQITDPVIGAFDTSKKICVYLEPFKETIQDEIDRVEIPLANETSITGTQFITPDSQSETQEVMFPTDASLKAKKFKRGVVYPMYVFDLTADEQGEAILNTPGSWFGTPNVYVKTGNTGETTLHVGQPLAFVVTENSIAKDPNITQSQYDYILRLIAKYYDFEPDGYYPITGGELGGTLQQTQPNYGVLTADGNGVEVSSLRTINVTKAGLYRDSVGITDSTVNHATYYKVDGISTSYPTGISWNDIKLPTSSGTLALQSEVSEVKDKADELSSEINAVSSLLTTTSRTVATHTTQISAITDECQSLQEQITTNAGNISTAQSDISSLQTRADTAETRWDGKGNQLRELTKCQLDAPDNPTTESVVTIDASGNVGTLAYSNTATANALALRNANGDIVVNETPTAAYAAASKFYVDQQVAGGVGSGDVTKDATNEDMYLNWSCSQMIALTPTITLSKGNLDTSMAEYYNTIAIDPSTGITYSGKDAEGNNVSTRYARTSINYGNAGGTAALEFPTEGGTLATQTWVTSQITSSLSSYVTTASLTSTLTSYITATNLNSILEGYAQKAELQEISDTAKNALEIANTASSSASSLSNSKLDIPSSAGLVYYNGSGTATLNRTLSATATADSVALRDESGCLVGATPTSSNQLATKAYVDSAVGGTSSQTIINQYKLSGFDTSMDFDFSTAAGQGIRQYDLTIIIHGTNSASEIGSGFLNVTMGGSAVFTSSTSVGYMASGYWGSNYGQVATAHIKATYYPCSDFTNFMCNCEVTMGEGFVDKGTTYSLSRILGPAYSKTLGVSIANASNISQITAFGTATSAQVFYLVTNSAEESGEEKE